MKTKPTAPWFWSSDKPAWNFGDALTVLLTEELICDFFPHRSRTHVMGSVIFDHLLPVSLDPENELKPPFHADRETRAVFWGCGIREPGSLRPDLISAVEILAVRGPITASDLRLGANVPMGDPALLLPAFYKPRRNAAFAGKVVCVPHFNDDRSDAAILAASGCDAVLRPAIRRNIAAIHSFIDAITSARFVLAGAMHAAISAAAYGVPFGFWDSGNIDIPTKWHDSAALLSIPCQFFKTAAEARDFHDREITPALRIPPLWPLVAAAPGFIKPVGLVKVLKHELERHMARPYPELDPYIDELAARTVQQDKFIDLARQISSDVLPQLRAERQSAGLALEAALSDKAALAAQLSTQTQAALENDRLTSQALSNVTAERDSLRAQAQVRTQEMERLAAERDRIAAENDVTKQTHFAALAEVSSLTARLKDEERHANEASHVQEAIAADRDGFRDLAQTRLLELEGLRASMAQMAKANETLAYARDQSLLEAAAMAKRLDEERREASEAASRASQACARLATDQQALQALAREYIEEINRLKEATTRLTAEHRALRESSEDQTAQQQHLETLRAAERLEHEQTLHALADLQISHEELRASAHAQAEEIHQLQVELGRMLDHERSTDRQRQEASLEPDGLLGEAEVGRAQALTEVDRLRGQLGTLSTALEDRRRAESELQQLVRSRDEQLRAQQVSTHQLESELLRLKQSLASAASAQALASERHEAARASFLQDTARLTIDNRALAESNDSLAGEIGHVRRDLQRSEIDATTQRRRIDQLEAEILEQRHEASILRQQSQALVAQHATLQGRLAYAESDNAARLARLNAGLSRYWHLIAKANNNFKGAGAVAKLVGLGKSIKVLRSRMAKINVFLETFTETELGLSKSGRNRRITQYLLGVTPEVEDFPIFHRDIYLLLNPDVAEKGLEPFIHFIENGQWERRSIHPALDLKYYTASYPEAGKFKMSPVEHYFKFGIKKNYDPSPLFSTEWYFRQYADVKASGLNPVIHYLRFPGCQPHPLFDSSYYQATNLDVVRQGFNPLAHYCLWGRSEGRRATASAPLPQQVITQVPTAAPIRQPATPTAAAQEEVAPAQPVGTNIPAPAEELALERAPTTLGKMVTTPLMQRVATPSTRIVVMMDAFYPRPDQDSGSLDQVNFVKIFRNLGYEVAFVSLLQFGEPAGAGQSVASLGARCISSAEFASVEEYLFLHQSQIAAVFLSRVHFGGAWIDRVRSFCPKALVLFNTVDLHHIREERAAALRSDAKELLVQASETKRLEYACIAAADVCIVVSDQEQKLLADELPASKVVVIPLIREIPRSAFPAFAKRNGLAFVGGFQHQPNIDAVTFFLDEIWPLVLAQRPGLTFHVIGSHLPAALSDRSDPHVDWVGYVPELEPWLDRIRLTVAPLRYGAGAKGKVVSSLINGVPCVATAVAAEGMGLKIGEDILGCDNPRDFAHAVISIHDDPAMWARFADAGFAAVHETYSIDHGQKRMGEILRAVPAE
jgi:glycosyltransferase involved in cell wall biosynthesis